MAGLLGLLALVLQEPGAALALSTGWLLSLGSPSSSNQLKHSHHCSCNPTSQFRLEREASFAPNGKPP